MFSTCCHRYCRSERSCFTSSRDLLKYKKTLEWESKNKQKIHGNIVYYTGTAGGLVFQHNNKHLGMLNRNQKSEIRVSSAATDFAKMMMFSVSSMVPL